MEKMQGMIWETKAKILDKNSTNAFIMLAIDAQNAKGAEEKKRSQETKKWNLWKRNSMKTMRKNHCERKTHKNLRKMGKNQNMW